MNEKYVENKSIFVIFNGCLIANAASVLHAVLPSTVCYMN